MAMLIAGGSFSLQVPMIDTVRGRPPHLGHHPPRLGPAMRLVAEAREEDLRLLRRAADRAGQQVPNPLLQHSVGWDPDSIADALTLEQLIDLRLGEPGIAAEVECDAALAVALDHWLKHVSPAFGAVHVAAAQGAALEVAELVEDEQRMIAAAAEMAVPGRATSPGVGRFRT